jgi:hypothetical protein
VRERELELNRLCHLRVISGRENARLIARQVNGSTTA